MVLGTSVVVQGLFIFIVLAYVVVTVDRTKWYFWITPFVFLVGFWVIDIFRFVL